MALCVHEHVQRGRGAAKYERYHVPASGNVFWGSVLANIHPGHDDTYVNYNNRDRAPLLFISGSEDHLMPPKIQRSNAKHYKAEGTITEVKEFEGRARTLHALAGGMGRGRRLRPNLGRRARIDEGGHFLGSRNRVSNEAAGWRNHPFAALRTDAHGGRRRPR